MAACSTNWRTVVEQWDSLLHWAASIQLICSGFKYPWLSMLRVIGCTCKRKQSNYFYRFVFKLIFNSYRIHMKRIFLFTCHRSTMQGKTSHKFFDPNENFIMRLYYQKDVLTFMCFCNEMFYSGLYLLHFTTGPTCKLIQQQFLLPVFIYSLQFLWILTHLY